MIVKMPRLKTAVVLLLGVSCILSSASTAPAQASTPSLIWDGANGVRSADLSHWNLAAVSKEFGKPTEVFALDKVGQSKINLWALPIPKDANTAWRYVPKDKEALLVEQIIFFRKDAPLRVIQRGRDW